MMTCDDARALIELDPADEQPDLAEHIEGCVDCRALLDEMREVQEMVKAQAPYYKAPAGLSERIRSQTRRPRPANYRWLAIAASVLLVASAATNVVLLRSRVSPERALAASIVSSHIRSLADTGQHLLDVPSTDQHTVKPWFNGKVDFSPNVKDLASDGFPLIGGRLEYIEGHAAAALVFERRKHIVNLFTWPSSGQESERHSTQNGYHTIRWAQDGMTYWAVSDLNEAELQTFVAHYHK